MVVTTSLALVSCGKTSEHSAAANETTSIASAQEFFKNCLDFQ
jgi:hypothetical protein